MLFGALLDLFFAFVLKHDNMFAPVELMAHSSPIHTEDRQHHCRERRDELGGTGEIAFPTRRIPEHGEADELSMYTP
jgi:hypothetical protein